MAVVDSSGEVTVVVGGRLVLVLVVLVERLETGCVGRDCRAERLSGSSELVGISPPRARSGGHREAAITEATLGPGEREVDLNPATFTRATVNEASDAAIEYVYPRVFWWATNRGDGAGLLKQVVVVAVRLVGCG